MSDLTISKLARRAGVGVETIRFYERKGLLERPPTPADGYRTYPPEALRRVRFIRRAKDLGFTLREIDDLLGLRIDPECRCDDVRARAVAKLDDVNERITGLVRVRDVLADLVAACEEVAPTGPCPILDALEDTDA